MKTYDPTKIITLACITANFLYAAPQPTPSPRPDPAPQRGRPDPFGENLFPPDLIMQAAPMLDLTEDQKQQLQSEVRQMHDQMPGLQSQLKEDNEKLVDLTKDARPNEAVVLAQADKVSESESAVKRLQLGMLIRLKNLLTPEQQAQLKELKTKMTGVQAKMARAQMAAQRARQEGRDISSLEDTRSQLGTLIGQGKFKEAEDLLDKVTEQLEAKK
ncbi:MAG: Spy/CpxP family protein refolding chaperone [Verrucomicrobiota bacterium]